MMSYMYRASNLKSTLTSGFSFIAEVNFWRPLKTIISCDLFIIIIIVIIFIIINFFRRVFSEYTEVNATSLILYTIHREKCAFIVGFSSTAWTKMRSLAGSLADGVLADTILIPPPRPPI